MRSLKIGKMFGIGIYVHWTFLILPISLIVMHLMGHLEHLGFFMLITGAIFGCVVLHEYGHALTARAFGIGTRDITLYPIGGVARLNRMSEKPVEEILIAVAGPGGQLGDCDFAWHWPHCRHAVFAAGVDDYYRTAHPQPRHVLVRLDCFKYLPDDF